VYKYKVVFNSTTIAEHHRDRVKSNLSIIFKVPVAKLAPLFTDRPVTLKKDLDLEAAKRYVRAVEREGGVCRMEIMGDSTSSLSMTIENTPIDAPTGINTESVAKAPPSKASAKASPKPSQSTHARRSDDTITCPRCMTRQKPADICVACGVILQNYENEIRRQKATQKWVAGVDPDRRRGRERRLHEDRRTGLRFQDDRRSGVERRASIAGWHRDRDAVRG
jgi:hypothetical protein